METRTAPFEEMSLDLKGGQQQRKQLHVAIVYPH